jgi:hypothetical protein
MPTAAKIHAATPRNGNGSSGVMPAPRPSSPSSPVTVAISAGHLSCWRSTPLARRSRRNGASTTAGSTTAANANSGMAIGNHGSASPTGFSTPIPFRLPSSASMVKRISPPQNPPSSQAIGRQRGDGSRPVGNSSTRKLKAAKFTGQIQCATQVAHTPPGSDPGAVTIARTAYSTLRTVTAETRPTATNSQPTGWLGRRVATTAPTVRTRTRRTRRAPARSAPRGWRPAGRWRSPQAASPGPTAARQRGRGCAASPEALLGWARGQHDQDQHR